MPTQSTTERLLASLHSLLSGAMPPGAKVLRNAILPEKVSAAGVVILRDGDPGPPEVWLSPPGYYYEHRAEIEVVVDGTSAARDAAFDTLRLAIGTALAADRTAGRAMRLHHARGTGTGAAGDRRQRGSEGGGDPGDPRLRHQ